MYRITDCLAQHALQQPNNIAVIDGTQRLTFAELLQAVEDVAAHLSAQGVVLGDRVAVRGHDGAATLVTALAVLSLGGIHAPVDHTLAEVEIETLILALQTPWRIDIPRSATISQLSTLSVQSTNQERTSDPLGAGNSAFLRLSSGTTGLAKGVLLSHASLLERITVANTGLLLSSGDRVLWLLPMAYHFAVSILLYIHFGVTIVFGNALRASGTATIAREHQVTFAYGSPWHIRRLADLPVGTDLPSSLQRVVSTTTALDATAAADFRARHGIGVSQGLGIIEVGLPFVSAGNAGEIPGDVGRPLAAYQVKLFDEHGEPSVVGQSGELAIRGPGVVDA
jgi:long-chain acyl-CoA synthetase